MQNIKEKRKQIIKKFVSYKKSHVIPLFIWLTALTLTLTFNAIISKACSLEIKLWKRVFAFALSFILIIFMPNLSYLINTTMLHSYASGETAFAAASESSNQETGTVSNKENNDSENNDTPNNSNDSEKSSSETKSGVQEEQGDKQSDIKDNDNPERSHSDINGSDDLGADTDLDDENKDTGMSSGNNDPDVNSSLDYSSDEAEINIEQQENQSTDEPAEITSIESNDFIIPGFMMASAVLNDVPDGEYFRFEVEIPSNSRTFAIPLRGGSGPNPNIAQNYDKPYHWTIDWGDGTIQTIRNSDPGAPRNSATSAGISRTYSAGGTYEITITPAAGSSTDAWFAAFGFRNDGTNNNKDRITKISSPLTPLMTRTAAGIESGDPIHFEWSETFDFCRFLTMDSGFTFKGWDDVTHVGNNFASGMFRWCQRMKMGDTFNLPQNITSVGDNFARGMFSNCFDPLFTMNDVFNLPENISTVGDGFASEMFLSCYGSSFTMNNVFNLPESISTVGDGFAQDMFRNCGASFNMNEVFNLPPAITTVGNSFASRMFSSCDGNSFTMNNGFNLPPGIINVGNSFAEGMFSSCRGNSFNMNGVFNLPQGVTAVGDDFARWMFDFCSSSAFNMNTVFNLPPGIMTVGDGFAANMFASSGGDAFTMNGIFNMPIGITEVGNDFAALMFSGCNGENFTMNEVFNLPQDIIKVGTDFANSMFCEIIGNEFNMNAVFNLPQKITVVEENFAFYMFGAWGSGCKLIINDVFKFPKLESAEVNKSGVLDLVFYDRCTTPQKRSAASIINGNPVPDSNKWTFDGSTGFSDLPYIHTNWGGGGLTRAVITINTQPEKTQTFTEGSISGSLSVLASVTEDANLSYQWYSNTVNSNTGGTAIPDAESASFTIPTGLTPGTHYYYCVVSADKGAIDAVTDVALVTVKPDKEEYFSFEITTSEPGETFSIPLNGAAGLNTNITLNYNKPYHWHIDWGNGASQVISSNDSDAPQNTASGAGIPHTYEDEGAYIITITPVGTQEAWFSAFGFRDSTALQSSRDMITKVISPITPLMTRTQQQLNDGTAPNFEWAETFSRCTNLTMGEDFTFSDCWDSIKTVGNNFANNLFSRCSGNTFTMGEKFNLPKNITTAGNNFVANMFFRCSGSSFTMNEIFNLPQNITTVGSHFASSMFNECSGSAFTMNENFNLPQGIEHAGNNFAIRMFSSCSGEIFTMNEKFTLPQSIKTVGEMFASGMFSECSGNTFTMSDNFNLPKNITTAGDHFASSMFSECTGSSFTMNEIFNLPQDITTVGSHFASMMFIGCSGSAFTMNKIFNLPQNITEAGNNFTSSMFSRCSGVKFNMNNEFNLPQNITVGDSFAHSMFNACSGGAFTMNDKFNLPQEIITTGTSFAMNMFQNCSGSAFTMNDNFNLPQKITTVGNFFAANMFSGCSGGAFMVNEKFKFPVLSQSEINKASVFTDTFRNIGQAPAQIRTAASIIGENPLPGSNRNTFTGSLCFSDLYDIDGRWGGQTRALITITVQPAAQTNLTEGSISGSLSVEASVTQTATLSYQWYSNTTDCNETGTAIVSATEDTFIIPTNLTAGTYYYYCVLSATHGALDVTSNVATVTVTVTDPCAAGHSFGAWEVATLATCTDDGEETRTCTTCSFTETRPIPAAHDFAAEYSQTLAPTCTAVGKESRKCNNCDERTDERDIPATGHTVSNQAAVDENCTLDLLCACGHIIAAGATGHKWGAWDTATKSRGCNDCKVTETDDAAPEGEISIKTNAFLAFLNTVTFGLLFSNTDEVTITGTDSSSGVAAIEYIIADTPFADEASAAAASGWKAYSGGFTLIIGTRIVYAKITDNAGNITVISTKTTDGDIVIYDCNDCGKYPCECVIEPSPSPTPSPSPSPSPRPTPSPTPTPTPDPVPTPDPTPEPSPDPVPTPDPTPEPITPSSIPATTPAIVQEPTPEPVSDEEIPTAESEADASITIIIETSADSPPTSINTPVQELYDIVFTPEELETIAAGEDAKIFVVIENINHIVSSDDKNQIETTLESDVLNEFVLGLFLDITKFKQIGYNDPIQLTELTQPVSISIEIPEELRMEGRTYKIIRIHNDEVSVIEGTYDHETGTFTFETDRFSTYALIFSDTFTDNTTSIEPEPNDDNTPAAASVLPEIADTTASQRWLWWLLLIIPAGLLLAYYGFIKKH